MTFSRRFGFFWGVGDWRGGGVGVGGGGLVVSGVLGGDVLIVRITLPKIARRRKDVFLLCTVLSEERE